MTGLVVRACTNLESLDYASVRNALCAAAEALPAISSPAPLAHPVRKEAIRE
jgi:hypothetical protein